METTVISDKKKKYECTFCGAEFYRWKCQVRDESKVKCSRLCANRCNMKNRDQAGEKNPMWKGGITKRLNNKPKRTPSESYSALHRWISRRFKKPKFCECCKTNSPRDLANISQEYKRDLSDWEWLCRKCHMTKDKRIDRLIDVLKNQNRNGILNPNYRNGRYIKRL